MTLAGSVVFSTGAASLFLFSAGFASSIGAGGVAPAGAAGYVLLATGLASAGTADSVLLEFDLASASFNTDAGVGGGLAPAGAAGPSFCFATSVTFGIPSLTCFMIAA